MSYIEWKMVNGKFNESKFMLETQCDDCSKRKVCVVLKLQIFSFLGIMNLRRYDKIEWDLYMELLQSLFDICKEDCKGKSEIQ